MRPLQLKGHERSITKIRYNREGDLLLSASKDNSPSIWFSDNGERLGTLEGHKGAVWDIDVSWDSATALTGSGDMYCMLWDIQTGRKVLEIFAETVVRAVGLSFSANLIFHTTDKQSSRERALRIFDLRDGQQISNNAPGRSLLLPQTSKPMCALWSHLDDSIIVGLESGEILQYDLRARSSEPKNSAKEHQKQVNDLQLSPDQLMLITSSKDKTAKLLDAHTLQPLKTYKSERPVNSAAMSPLRDHIVLGGGEEAMTVTQTDARQGQFEAKFYHLIFEDEFARVKGHFGPINSLAFHPEGRAYSSGGEDGYVRVQVFDDEYFEFEFDH